MRGGSSNNLELGVCVVEACLLGVCEKILGGLYLIDTGWGGQFRIKRKIRIIRNDLKLNIIVKK